MNQLQEFANCQPNWSLEEFVRLVNRLLPEILPEERTNTRVREEVTARLVRYYTTQGMLDEPLRQGREVRYQYRHLLQVLLLRKLLAAGYGAGAIAQFVVERGNSELESLLQGDIGLTIASTAITPNNSALEFLQQIQTNPAPTAMPLTSASRTIQPNEARSSSPHSLYSSQWRRIEIASGLEIHVRDRFSYPTDPQERQQLLKKILQALQFPSQ
jgi:DNA-binding transcriptional MerR regulator